MCLHPIALRLVVLTCSVDMDSSQFEVSFMDLGFLMHRHGCGRLKSLDA